MTEETKSTPGVPAQLNELISNEVIHDNTLKILDDRNRIYDQDYILHFSTGNKVDFKIFHFEGTFAQALKRGQRHCRLVGIRFLYIRPFITNLDAQERKHLRLPEDAPIPDNL